MAQKITRNADGILLVPAAIYKVRSLHYCEYVAKTGKPVIVTKRGLEHVMLTPVIRRLGNKFIGSSKGMVTLPKGTEVLNQPLDASYVHPEVGSLPANRPNTATTSHSLGSGLPQKENEQI